ncbi:MAG: permease [Legionellales bacterium RIFCSPHIGHO2_12_FULL_37_14]|nr:MAG: permease [Legionellales bacterium RIFCSPHIGHO2_12_FULL_37_14]
MLFGWVNLLYLLTGCFTGLMSGTLGIGGGVVVVPALMFILELNNLVPAALSMHMAAGSSLAIILFTSISALRAHRSIEPILWEVYGRLWPGIILGTIFGAILASFLSTSVLRVIFALFLLFVAYKMAFAQREQIASFPSKWLNQLVSFIVGLKSGLLGVGGGVLIIPYLTYCGVNPRRIAPVSSLCTMTVAFIGTLTFMFLSHDLTKVKYATGYVYWPAVFWVTLASTLAAPLGAKLSYVLPLRVMRYAFIGILLLTVVGLVL